MVFALNKKSPPSAAILFSFANLRLPGNFTGGLREVKTSRNLPGKLPGKLTGSKITGVSRNTRKVYGSLTGDLPGPIIYRVFRETGPRCHYRPNKCLIGPKIGQIRLKDMPHKAKDTRQIRLENAPNKQNVRNQKTATPGSKNMPQRQSNSPKI